MSVKWSLKTKPWRRLTQEDFLLECLDKLQTRRAGSWRRDEVIWSWWWNGWWVTHVSLEGKHFIITERPPFIELRISCLIQFSLRLFWLLPEQFWTEFFSSNQSQETTMYSLAKKRLGIKLLWSKDWLTIPCRDRIANLFITLLYVNKSEGRYPDITGSTRK